MLKESGTGISEKHAKKSNRKRIKIRKSKKPEIFHSSEDWHFGTESSSKMIEKKLDWSKQYTKKKKLTEEITLSMKGLKASEAAAIQLFKELDESKRRKQTHQLILEKIEKSREHLNNLKELYQTKAKKQISHLEELLESDDEDIQTKILREPIIYVTDSGDEPKDAKDTNIATSTNQGNITIDKPNVENTKIIPTSSQSNTTSDKPNVENTKIIPTSSQSNITSDKPNIENAEIKHTPTKTRLYYNPGVLTHSRYKKRSATSDEEDNYRSHNSDRSHRMYRPRIQDLRRKRRKITIHIDEE